MKFASANFYLNLSLKAKDFTRARREFHLATARFHISPKAKYFTAMLSTIKLTALPRFGALH